MESNGHQEAVPAGIEIMPMPAEITYQNAQDVEVEVVSALSQGHSVLVVDLTQTRYCDSSGIRELVQAHHLAAAIGVDYRVVLPPSPYMARLWSLRGLDQVIRTYPTVTAALDRPAPAADGEVLSD